MHFTLQMTDTPENASIEAPIRNSPRIAAFIGEENKQYFIIVEQKVLCQVPSIQFAIFIVFSSYYVFHLEYPNCKIMCYHTRTQCVDQVLTWQQLQILKNSLICN